jgi:hypothetical protein
MKYGIAFNHDGDKSQAMNASYGLGPSAASLTAQDDFKST